MTAAGGGEAVFEMLHPSVQRWVYDQGWTTLHPIQQQAARPIMDATADVLIAAATAAGKTEAAFLPIVSALASDPPSAGIAVIAVSPLKALINDQYSRISDMCARAHVPVHRWHGDVAASAKRRVIAQPGGILLITPESLEAQFVTKGWQMPQILAGLRYVVIDEMHVFLGSPRGAQAQSLIRRCALAAGHRPRRVGLSATLGDLPAAAAFLCPEDPASVHIIDSGSSGMDLRMQMRGYLHHSSADAQTTEDDSAADGVTAPYQIASHISENLRGADNLVFANSRAAVENYSDLLASISHEAGAPNEFWAHHGSLSKDAREAVEEALRDPSPATAICTSTLELGIDIGSVKTVAQIGTPPTVAALRQRLGRCGRRGSAAELRIYVTEPPEEACTSAVTALRCTAVQTAATIRLMLAGWVESPEDPGFNYSTLIQQTLSVIAELGGASPAELYRRLGGPGPFGLVDARRYARLLQAMRNAGLIAQMPEGLLLPDIAGEAQINHFSFYAAFETTDEWRLTAGGRSIGSIPISHPLHRGMRLIFSGRRWEVETIDASARVAGLRPSLGGNPPIFSGSPAQVSDEVRAEMSKVYESDDTPRWADRCARDLIEQGRCAYRELGLAHSRAIEDGDDLLVFPWLGDRALFSAEIALVAENIPASVEGPALRVPDPDGAAEALGRIASAGPLDAIALAEKIENRLINKWDWVLDDGLAVESAAALLVDVQGAQRVLDAAASALR